MKRLKKILKFTKPQKSHIPKLVSVLVATILWGYVVSAQDTEKSFEIPIGYQGLAEDVVVSEISHKFISVTVSGRSNAVKSVNAEDFQAFIDLENAEVGRVEEFPVHLVKVNVPENVNVSTQRVSAFVKLEHLISKKVIIAPKILGQLRRDKMLGAVSVTPEYTIVKGAKSLIDSLEKVRTKGIYISNLRQTISKKVEMDKQYKNKGIMLADTVVEVNISIYKDEEYDEEEID